MRKDCGMSNTPANEQFLTTAEIVKATGTTPATVTRWVAAGKLSPIHKGQGIRGAFLFDRKDVETFLESRKQRTHS
jgi:predicted site-specific integrase-resolvase